MKLDKFLAGQDPFEVLSFEPVVVTMANGDLILCELAELDDDNYCMMTPFRMIEMESEDEEMHLQAVRFVPGSHDIFFHIAATHVVAAGMMTTEMFDFYVKAVDRMIESMKLPGDEDKKEQNKSNVVSLNTRNPVVH
jgi:hypothetical protein